MIDQSAIAIVPYPGKNMRHFLIGFRLGQTFFITCFSDQFFTNIFEEEGIKKKVFFWELFGFSNKIND
jgi:hypothetical protein